MSLGLPVHLEPVNISRAFARGSHTFALVCLLSALVCLVAIQLASPSVMLWPAVLALAPMFLLLWLNDRSGSRRSALAYVLIGAASIYWYVYAGIGELPGASPTDNILVSLPKVALIMVGWPRVGRWSPIGWCVSAYLLAEGATALAASQAGAVVVVDGTSLLVTVVVVLFLAFIAARGHAVQPAKPSLLRAARDEHLADMRSRVEVQAAAVLHDTVLNDLAAIASTPTGPLSAELGSQVERDLEVIVGEEWLVGMVADRGGSDVVVDGWQASRFARVIDDGVRLGLTIDVSGDTSAIARLTPSRATAVALAAKQCLANVARHAGVDRAEVVVFGSESEVSIMVIDAGRGFTVGDTGRDRLGLSYSVRKRIETVGGAVQVWSTPGRGTSVLIRVPAGAAASVSDGAGR